MLQKSDFMAAAPSKRKRILKGWFRPTRRERKAVAKKVVRISARDSLDLMKKKKVGVKPLETLAEKSDHVARNIALRFALDSVGAFDPAVRKYVRSQVERMGNVVESPESSFSERLYYRSIDNINDMLGVLNGFCLHEGILELIV